MESEKEDGIARMTSDEVADADVVTCSDTDGADVALPDTQNEQAAKSGGVLSYMGEKKRKPTPLEILKKYCKRYFIDAFTGMAQGLFCTLIAGTILAQIASWCGQNGFALTLDYISRLAKVLMGAGIGVGIAHKLGAKPLVIFSAAVTGLVGAFAGQMVEALVHGTHFDLVVLDTLKRRASATP